MEYATLATTLRELEETDADLELVETLADLFRAADEELPRLVTLVRGKIAPRWEQVELGVSSSLTTDAILRATGVSESELEERWRERGDLGAAAEWAVANSRQATLVSETLTVQRVTETLRELATYEGSGSQSRKVETIAGMVSNADPTEARYLVRTALGYMRIGVGDGTIRDALAEAFLDAPGEPAPGTPSATQPAVDAVERAYQLTNDYRVVARVAREEGIDGLRAVDLELGRPVEVMLARKAEGLTEALADVARDASETTGAATAPESETASDAAITTDAETVPDTETTTDVKTTRDAERTTDVETEPDAGQHDTPDWQGRVIAETKYDGIRVQTHVDNDVQLFTRRLVDVTEQFPEIVAGLREAVTADTALLDGELVGYDAETDEPVAFQEFSRRVKREEAVEELAAEIPARFHAFDVLACDGETLLDEPLRDRLAVLRETFTETDTVTRAAATRPETAEEARTFYQSAVSAGHEGMMTKNLEAAYQPGRRVGQMLKHKPVMEPLDLVVTRAQYSEGRRSELLGRLYLAAYDPADDAFREVGRLSTGYTDAELERLTDRLEERVQSRDGRDVTLRPTTVLEVEYEEIQESPEYDSGYALRFPRFLDVRGDLAPEDADTVDRVATLYDDG